MIKVNCILRGVLVSAILMGMGALSAVVAQVVEKERARGTDGRQGAQRTAVDPQTGKLREPTEAEAAQLTDALNKAYGRSSTDIKMTFHDNGMISAELPKDFAEVMVVKINPDGSLSKECVTGMKNAEARVQELAGVQPAQKAKKAAAAGKMRVARKVARKEAVR